MGPQGKRYLDFVQGWAVNCLGHSPAVIADALAAQARKLMTPSPAFYNEPSLKLASALVANSCFDQVFFTNCGAEANEGAIKLARKWGTLYKGGAYEIITFVGRLPRPHARHHVGVRQEGVRAAVRAEGAGFPKAQLNDLASVEAADHRARRSRVMLEPIQGEAGVLAGDRRSSCASCAR